MSPRLPPELYPMEIPKSGPSRSEEEEFPLRSHEGQGTVEGSENRIVSSFHSFPPSLFAAGGADLFS